MTKLFFVRHAQPEHSWDDDRTRPLTEQGIKDTEKVLKFFKSLEIDSFYCSPYKRSIQTIESTAKFFCTEILIDKRLRERKKGVDGNNHGMFQKRWADKDFCEANGESINMVQKRNIDAVFDIIDNNKDKMVVVGTHGTALSSILNYFDNSFDYEAFSRIIDWMPYIIELDFSKRNLTDKIEHLYVQKEFTEKVRADK